MVYSIKEREEYRKMTFVVLDWEWIDDQLKKDGSAGTPTGDTIKSLLHTLEDNEFRNKDLDKLDSILERVGELARGHVIVDESDETWEDVVTGELSVRDIVRVRPDAYNGLTGITHNTKRGRVTVIRNGVATVVYEGETPDSAIGHNFDNLQKLKVE